MERSLREGSGGLLPTFSEPKGSQAPCGVWRGDSGLLFRPCRKRRPSSRNDRGVLLVFSSCGASVRSSTVHGILQARILEWVAMPFSRGHSVQFSRSVVSDSLCLQGRQVLVEDFSQQREDDSVLWGVRAGSWILENAHSSRLPLATRMET